MFIELPSDVQAFLNEIDRAVASLVKWETASPHVKSGHRKAKKFTADGRMIGDIGEVLAERFFQIRLEKNQKAGYDAVLEKDEQIRVEIKVTRHQRFQFRKVAQRLIVLALQRDRVEVVFNGFGKRLVEHLEAAGAAVQFQNNHWTLPHPRGVSTAQLRLLTPVNGEGAVPLRDGINLIPAEKAPRKA
jgi:hypothetical protein